LYSTGTSVQDLEHRNSSLYSHVTVCGIFGRLALPCWHDPSWKTDFAACGFRHSAPAVWNSLPKTVLDSSSLTVFSNLG